MSFIVWHDHFNVNVPEIDSQHQELANLVNELHDAVSSDCDSKTLDALMKKLLQLTERHFVAEEALMIEHQYPGYAIHKAQHDDLMAKLRHFAEAVSGMPPSAFRFDFDISTDWLMKHIEQSDKRLGEFLNRQDT